MKKQRKHYTAEEKVAILRRRLVENVAVSDLCEEMVLQPAVFYRWQKEFFENGAAAFEQKGGRSHPVRAGTDRVSGKEDPDEGRGAGRADGGACGIKKKLWGTLTGIWVPHDTRDRIVDFVRRGAEKTDIGVGRFIEWLGVGASKFYDWRERYGKANEHNAWVPRDFWLEDWEKQAIVDFHLQNPLEGYRRLTFMMLDRDVVAVSPSSVWRVLGQAGLLAKWNGQSSKKGTGFAQPPAAHEHWHIDVCYINIGGTFYYLCSVLDGYSRFLVHWELRASMTEAEIEIVLQRAREQISGEPAGFCTNFC